MYDEIGECADIGAYGPCKGEITLQPCPFVEEIYNKIIETWLCEYHAGERALDV